MPLPRCSRPPGNLPSPNSGLLPSLLQSLGGQPPGTGASAAVGLTTGAFQRRVWEETGMSRGTFYDLFKEAKKQQLIQKKGDLWHPVQKVQKVQSDARTDQ